MAQKLHKKIADRIKARKQQIADLRQLDRFLKHLQSLFDGSGAEYNEPGYDRNRRIQLSFFDSEININFNYDHVLADVDDLRTLRQAGYYQTDKKGDWFKPQTDKSNGTTTYHLFHKEWKDGETPVATLFAGLREGDSPTCKKVKVRTETRQIDVYEVRCNGLEIDEAPQIIREDSNGVQG